MKKKINIYLALLLILTLLMGGCGKGSVSTENSSAMDEKQEAAADAGWGTEESYAAADTSMTDSVAQEEMPEEGEASKVTENDLSSRKLIKTVSLSMETKAFDTMKSEMESSISACNGYIQYSSFDAPQGQNNYRYYSITARIPSDRLDEFVAAAGKLGTVTNKSENVEDVTLDYVDKTAYKESLQVEYDRVTTLLEKAEDLDQILALESKLSELRYEINSYESQLRTYDNLIDYSTVNIYISEVEYEKETEDTIGSRIKNGFSQSLYAVRDFFVNFFVFLVSNLPILLLLAAVVAVIILVIKKCILRRGKKHQKNSLPPEAPVKGDAPKADEKQTKEHTQDGPDENNNK
jgi:hypothetical protein